MKINVNGTWKDSKPYVNVGGVWKPVSVGWVNVNGSWKKMFTSESVHSITDAHTDFNLYNTIGLPDADVIRVVLQPGSVFRASSSGIPAFNVGNAYAGKTLIIENRGQILGKGGAGGAGGAKGSISGAHNGAAGGAGGTALYVRTTSPVQFHNYGYIGGGGGGGGGGGSSYISGRYSYGDGKERPYSSASTGGRGGNGADGAGAGAEGSAGISSTYATGGRGGNGGGQGAAGANGAGGTYRKHANDVSGARLYTGAGGAGGRAGYAIDGNSRVQLLTAGSVAGLRVN